MTEIVVLTLKAAAAFTGDTCAQTLAFFAYLCINARFPLIDITVAIIIFTVAELFARRLGGAV